MKGLIKIIIFFIIAVIVGSGVFFKLTYDSDHNVVVQEGKEEECVDTKDGGAIEKKEADIIYEEVVKEEKIDYINIEPVEVYIPILMYHSISDSDSGNSLMVPTSQFTEQMRWLKEENFTPMLIDDVIDALKSGKVPKRPVAITFDDGYADNYTDAYKTLIDNNMKATFFIITDKTDTDSSCMNSSMLKEMASRGMGIENHTSKHMELNALSRDEKIAIIKDGKDALKEKVGVDSKYLCYPVGRYDDETIEVVKELGLKGAVTTEGGFSNITNGEFRFKRVRISPMGIENFKSIFESFIIQN